jgi:hypothetical protein
MAVRLDISMIVQGLMDLNIEVIAEGYSIVGLTRTTRHRVATIVLLISGCFWSQKFSERSEIVKR